MNNWGQKTATNKNDTNCESPRPDGVQEEIEKCLQHKSPYKGGGKRELGV